jgi:hypothetical protein
MTITYAVDETGRKIGIPPQTAAPAKHVGSGPVIERVDENGKRTQIDLRNLSVGDRKCADMTQAELHRLLKHLVPDVRVDDGHQVLCEKLAAYMARVAA